MDGYVFKREVTVTDSVKIGDRLVVGKYTATVMNCFYEKNGTKMYCLCCLDQCIDQTYSYIDILNRLNEDLENDSNFASILSKLLPWIEVVSDNVITTYRFRLPYVGEIFGQDQNLYDALETEPDCCSLWEPMKKRLNRIGTGTNDRLSDYWLTNKSRQGKADADAYFCSACCNGYATVHPTSTFCGVRPVFMLTIHNKTQERKQNNV